MLALALAVAPGAMGQTDDAAAPWRAGPPVSIIVHHPNDGVDGLGFDWQGTGQAPFVARYAAALDPQRDGFGYPSLLVDGVIFTDGLPDSEQPARTRDLYEEQLATRIQGANTGGRAPIQLDVAALRGGAQAAGNPSVPALLDAMVVVTPIAADSLADEELSLWVALVQDPVHYAPPAAISNGITEHRLTLRALHHGGTINATDGLRIRHTFDLHDANVLPQSSESSTTLSRTDNVWDELALVVWVQADRPGAIYQAREVAQATTHPVSQAAPTRQTDRGVLMELLSATWCDPCLFGDRAIEHLADDYGHPALRLGDASVRTYGQAMPMLALLAAGVAALAVALLPAKRIGPRRDHDNEGNEGSP